MNKNLTYGKIILLALLLAGLPLACTELVNVELESNEPQLVVEGSVTTDSVRHQVQLTVTSDYYSNKPPAGYSGAVVELLFNDEILLLEESGSLAGLYETPFAFRGIPGTTYNLDINLVDLKQNGEFESFQASSTMPGGAELDYIEIEHYQTSILSGYVVFMYASHLPYQRDWFGFKLIKNGMLLTDSLSNYLVMADDLFDDGYFPGLPVGFLNDNDPNQSVYPGDTVTLQLDCIDQTYYDFIAGARLEIVGNYPIFSGPPANLKTNLTNGAFGIFTAYQVLRSSVVLQ
jgi:hypothetical protein